MKKTYFSIAYGCQMNKYDSQRIAKYLESKNYRPVNKVEQASLVVISMCSVRQKAVDKVYNQVTKLNSLTNKPKIILTGCVLNSDKKKFSELGAKIKSFNFLKNNKFRSDTRGFVPIMRGCNNFCSYCVVPYTRGREKSRQVDEILCEIKHLIANNIPEITLLGQNVNSYKYNNIDFADLLNLVNKLQGNFKISFLTNHPKDMSDKLINTIASCEKVVKKIHLPFQSGDNAILKKMNRGYTREQYLQLVKKIRKAIPNVELTTDVIVGFPGETQKQFQNTVDLMKKVNFKTAYIAMYSPRKGTSAYKLKDDVLLEEKKQRHRLLLALVK